MPFSYARFVKVCEERVEQSGAVQVKVKDRRGSTGSVGSRCMCDEVSHVDDGEEAESGGIVGVFSAMFVLLDITLVPDVRAGPPEVVLYAPTPSLNRSCTDIDAGSEAWGVTRLRRGSARPVLRNRRE
jgi:hypothetical protein